MTTDFSSLQRAAVSLVGALFLATLFVGTAVVPSEARAADFVASAR